MTAEIAVLNFHGVAMAADSAVSIGSTKIYNSANKLFALSKTHPVGIMVYGNAQTMSVPWETLIKTYRLELKNKKFKTLNEYGDNFIKYLINTTNIGFENENVYINNRVGGLIQGLSQKIVDDDIKKEFDKNPNLTSAQIFTIISKLINSYCSSITVKEKLDGLNNKWVLALKKKIAPIVTSLIQTHFENIPITSKDKKLILEACASIFYGKKYNPEHSGIVIAGFGDNEIYPSLISYEIEWRLMGYLKYRIKNDEALNVNNNAAIIPFAQREMVDTFMMGSDPWLVNYINTKMQDIFSNLTNTIFSGTKVKISKKDSPLIKTNSDKLINELASEVASVQRIKFVQPVLDSVAALPLDELAAMAQTLINMTSFKRRVSLNAESVGGPIDVAVISKGDGFIWINRKHYFKPEFNQHYFVNNSQKD